MASGIFSILLCKHNSPGFFYDIHWTSRMVWKNEEELNKKLNKKLKKNFDNKKCLSSLCYFGKNFGIDQKINLPYFPESTFIDTCKTRRPVSSCNGMERRWNIWNCLYNCLQKSLYIGKIPPLRDKVVTSVRLCPGDFFLFMSMYISAGPNFILVSRSKIFWWKFSLSWNLYYKVRKLTIKYVTLIENF